MADQQSDALITPVDLVPQRDRLSLAAESLSEPMTPPQDLLQLQQKIVQLEVENAQLRQALQSHEETVDQPPFSAQVAAPIAAITALRELVIQHYSLFLESTPAPMCMSLLDGTILYVNQMTYQNFGLTMASENYRALDFYADPSDRQKLLQQLRQQGMIQGQEVRVKTADGQLRWVEVHMRCLNILDTEVLLTLLPDITERKLATERLWESQAELRLITDSLPGGVAYVNTDRRYLFVNLTYERWLRRPRSEIIGKAIWEVLGETSYNNCKVYIDQVLAGQATWFETITHPLPGQTRYIEGRLVPDFDEHNCVCGYYALITDTTERKEIEQALKMAEKNYRGIFENALNGIFQMNEMGQYITLNRAMADIHGYDSPEAMLQAIDQSAPRSYVDAEAWAEFQSRLNCDDQVTSFEYRAYKCNGDIIWITKNARAVRDLNGTLLYYEGIIEDITQRKQAEAVLKQQVRQLQIEIDEQRRWQEVNQVISSDFFQEIQAELHNFRPY